jgi:hypothetical protein
MRGEGVAVKMFDPLQCHRDTILSNPNGYVPPGVKMHKSAFSAITRMAIA